MSSNNANTPEGLPTRQAVEAALKTFSSQIELVEMTLDAKAKMVRFYYDALVKQGFTPEQALQLTACSKVNV